MSSGARQCNQAAWRTQQVKREKGEAICGRQGDQENHRRAEEAGEHRRG